MFSTRKFLDMPSQSQCFLAFQCVSEGEQPSSLEPQDWLLIERAVTSVRNCYLEQ